MNLEAGTRLGDYRILSRIGRGSYGMVFEAEHVITRRVDAVKLLYDAGPSSADEEQRFLREIQVQASLRHPNIATVFTAFRTEWGLALAMELVPGETLGELMKKGRPPLAEGIRYIQETLSALACAERAGIVHRDIKPDNILIMPDGHVKITDFGLAYFHGCARITSSGENLGTPCYMSPEQVIGTEPVDARTDVYATAVVLYEIATGVTPFRGSNGFAVMLAHQNTAPVPPREIEPTLGPKLNQTILTALEKAPEKRFQNAEEFSKALARAASELTVPIPITLPVRRRRRWGTARIRSMIGGVAACGFVLTWIALGMLHKSDALAQRQEAMTPAAASPAPVPVVPVPVSVVPTPPVATAPPVPAPTVVDVRPAEEPAPVAPRRRRVAAKPAPQPAAPRAEVAAKPPLVEPLRVPKPAADAPPESAARSIATPEPRLDAPATPPPQPASPSPAAVAAEDPTTATPKKPNVFKRAVNKLLRKRDRPAAADAVSPPKPDRQN